MSYGKVSDVSIFCHIAPTARSCWRFNTEISPNYKNCAPKTSEQC